MKTLTKVYEVRDTTDYEMYYSLGLFESIPQIFTYYKKEFDKGEGVAERCYEYEEEELSIYLREVGKQDLHQEHLVGRVRRKVNYNEEQDEYILSSPVLSGDLEKEVWGEAK